MPSPPGGRVRIAPSVAVPQAAAAVVVAGLLAPPLPAQEPPVFPGGTQAVVLDVVARDRKGRTVPDLRAEEFTVLEEGLPRPITRFRFVAAPKAGPAMPGEAAPPTPDRIRNPILVSLVFDALGNEGRRFARKAAFELLEKDEGPQTLYAVFHVGLRLRMLQQLTPDRAAARAAVEAACGTIDPRAVLPGELESAAAAERTSRANDASSKPTTPASGASSSAST
ncbi:MAG TPA: VWA domain-containing protein [Vicinamibacteria bacterium]